MGLCAAVLTIGLAATDAGPPRVVPPRLPLEAVTGGEVILQVSLGPVGQVKSIEVLKHSPGFTEPLEAAVRQWRFGPSETGGDRQVLVAGMFRPPTLVDVATPVPPAPAAGAAVPIPVRWERPAYPPTALGDGVVVVEVRVGAGGAVSDATVVHSSPAFDGAARDTARRWSFRPAVRQGVAEESTAYVVFGFRQPVVSSRPGDKR
jgi:TonB family protein